MLESLVWMFKVDNFKKHFLYLFLFGIGCFVVALIISLISMNFSFEGNLLIYISLKAVIFLCLLLPLLCISGYFWCLTDNIVNREDDVITSNVYNGKIKLADKIELPELKTGKFLWRGIASIFATVLLYIPCIMLTGLNFVDMSQVAEFWGWSRGFLGLFGNGLAIFVTVFIPAMLWNYARRDSIFAVWNLPKAVYIIGNYTAKYIYNTFLFIIIMFLISYLIKFSVTLVVLTFTKTIAENGSTLYPFSGNDIFMPLILLFFINYSIGIYWVFVNSYLLGTIAPPSEY